MTDMSFAEAAERHLDDVYGYLAWFTGDGAEGADGADGTGRADGSHVRKVYGVRLEVPPGSGPHSGFDRGGPRERNPHALA